MRLHLDFETYSELDIRKVGSRTYAEHESTEPLMLSYAINDFRPNCWDIHRGQRMPTDLHIALENPEYTIHAFNAAFERNIIQCKFPQLAEHIHDHRWRCTMTEAYALSFSGGLDEVLEQTGLEVRKSPDGTALIRRFSQPQPANRKVRRWTADNDPAGYDRFIKYNLNDVIVERELCKWITARYNLTPREMETFFLDMRINDAGLPIDQCVVDGALRIYDEEYAQLYAEAKCITGCDNPNSPTQLMEWLRNNGVNTGGTLTAEVVAGLLKRNRDMPDHARRLLELRQKMSKTSITKYEALDRATARDGRLHGAFQFRGASRTGRYAGRIFQPQNLPRGSLKDPVLAADIIASGSREFLAALCGDVTDALSSCVRCAVTAPPGYALAVCDWSSIESRVLGYIADDRNLNAVFENNLDPYKAYASVLFSTPYNEITKAQRNYAKPPSLGCGYRLGANGLVDYAAAMGVEMSLVQAGIAVNAFRAQYPQVVQLWYDLERATHYAVEHHKACRLRDLMISCDGEFLRIVLPSGRTLCYHKPELKLTPMPWGGEKMTLTFMGRDTYTHQWCRQAAHGGVLTENIVQAVAYDILCMGLHRLDGLGHKIIGHVHDEIIIETPERDAGRTLDTMVDVMSRSPLWAPSLRLGAAGFTTRRYRKD